MASYDLYTVAQLKELLRARNLAISGRKAALVQRLQYDDAANAQDGQSVDGDDLIQQDVEPVDAELEEPVSKEDVDDDEFQPQAEGEEEEEEEEEEEDDEEADTRGDYASAKNELDEDRDSNGDNATDLSQSDVEYEADDFTEVILQDGTIERVVMPEGFTEAIDEDEFEKEIKSDPIYEMLNERRKYRLSMVIVSGEANAKMKNQAELDFSDSAPTKKFPPKTIKFISCSAGRYIQMYEKGRRKFKEMSEEEMTKENAVGTERPCECEVCTKRRKNDEIFRDGELRSGKTRGWTKYGVGHVLGSAPSSGPSKQ